mmetsp:Transcript_60357/g.141242  ORF Transcript_60357/g.141242 Transcript_60357/m.141242 type:complete len:81 (-) Transcript_60357:114-356(-)
MSQWAPMLAGYASEVQFLLPDFTVLVGPGLCKGSPEHPGRSPRQNWKHQRLVAWQAARACGLKRPEKQHRHMLMLKPQER